MASAAAAETMRPPDSGGRASFAAMLSAPHTFSTRLRYVQARRAPRARVAEQTPATRQATSPKQTLTERMFDELADFNRENVQAGGAGGGTTLADLQNMDRVWERVRAPQTSTSAPQVVTTSAVSLGGTAEYDVVICGGTLGVFLATALQLRGVRCAVLERGALRGRAQEWNVSRREMRALVATGVLTEEDVEDIIGLEFNPVRVAFNGETEIWTEDVLNLGVRPDVMIPLVAERFKAAGGVVLDNTAATSFTVHPDGVAIGLGGDDAPLTSRLLLDCMGHASPIVRQLRHGQKPDGVCCVVGTLASGFPEEQNKSSDLILTDRDIEQQRDLQYFWEAFPAGAGPSHRTTYLFAYLDAHPDRPSLQSLLDDYWRAMPEYQGVALERLQVERILFGFFPTYRSSPLAPGFDRVLQIGDASGVQSPLSFGGFGALTRHIGRLSNAVTQALEADLLDRRSLGAINAYNPGLSSAWMLQRAMSVRPGERVDRHLINRMLGANFRAMADSGDAVMRPFLQDVMKFGPFARTVVGQMTTDPLFVPKVVAHVGIPAMLDWTRHFVALGAYDVAYRLTQPLRRAAEQGKWDAKRRYRVSRWLDALEYGSGHDHDEPARDAKH